MMISPEFRFYKNINNDLFSNKLEKFVSNT